ncbi:hypothetical protein Y032_0156g3116 [Ancylostoma ceylanicum]|uniref:Reverse transcriptase domain-containing protein n=1 Tax=Ancylostoma ceylanicum TaxID=53326 RepID=A0A016SZI4_9BILA|nr:hypothetical protein Y032_0156g3116 [Ancylostoma ceylanicum]
MGLRTSHLMWLISIRMWRNQQRFVHWSSKDSTLLCGMIERVLCNAHAKNDIALIMRSPDDASEMLRRLDEKESKASLTIKTAKAKVIRGAFSSQQPVLLQGVSLEDVGK